MSTPVSPGSMQRSNTASSLQTDNDTKELPERTAPKSFKPIPGSTLIDLLSPKMSAAMTNPLITVTWLNGLYGECFKVKLLGKSLTFISSQRNISKMLSTGNVRKEAHDFLRELQLSAGESLFTAENGSVNWGKAHRILMPAFGAMAVRNMYNEMNDVLRTMITRWHSHQDQPMDIPDQLTRLTLDTIALCSFNYRFNSFYKEEMHPFVNDMLEFLTLSARRTLMPLNKFLNLRQWQAWSSARARLTRFADGLVEERLKLKGNEPKDLCHRMMHVADPETGDKLDRDDVVAQLITFLIAGHETTSGMLSFALYYMVKNPTTMRKAQEEVDRIGFITQDSLTKMPYIDAILKESLRLQPTAPMFSVSSDEDVELPSGHLIPTRQPVMINLAGLHLDPKVWGPDPEAFRPERMLDGAFEKLPPHSWKPFGNGIRACIGRAFAIQEAILAVASIVQNFDLELADPSYDLKVKFSLTIKPDDMKMIVRRRVNKPPVFPLMSWEKADTRDIPQNNEQEETQEASGPSSVKVLFGSNSGSCEALANDLGAVLNSRRFNAEVSTMDSCLRMAPGETILICTASYEGKPCDNARQFMAFVESNPNLKGVKYAVFGAGHHDWVETYMNVPRTLDSKMSELGAERLVQRGEGDVAGDFIGEFENWKEAVLKELRVDADAGPEATDKALQYVPLTSKTLNVSVNKGLAVGKVLDNVELVAASEDTEAKRHITVQLPDGQVYEAGDYLAVLPKNPDANVMRVLKRFKFDRDGMISMISSREGANGSDARKESLTVPVRVYDLVESAVELNAPVQRRMLPLLASLCQDSSEKEFIASLDGENYASKVLEKRVSTIDLLERCPSCSVTFDQYIKSLRMLNQRQYSISSSPLSQPDICTITIDIVRGVATSGGGEFQGVTSNYLASLQAGDEISCAIRSSSSFHLPSDPATPVVCFATGTGIAPFRAFFQERVLQLRHGREDVGKTVLFYGCRNQEDALHRDEFDAWRAEFPDHIIVYNSYSRVEGHKYKYVQDILFDKSDEVLQLFDAGASFYTCGSASKLSNSLRGAFKEMVDRYKGDEKQFERAQAFLAATNTSRYSVDVFT